MRRLPLVLLLLPAAVLASDPSSKSNIAAVTTPGIEGVWQLVSLETRGEQSKLPPGVTTYHFRGGQLAIKLPKDVLRVPYAEDATKRPHWIAMGADMEGIYRITGNRLEVCGGPRGQRPQDFKTKKGQAATLAILTRISR
jgi:uncharacterized protein (TIGR03067 family)